MTPQRDVRPSRRAYIAGPSKWSLPSTVATWAPQIANRSVMMVIGPIVLIGMAACSSSPSAGQAAASTNSSTPAASSKAALAGDSTQAKAPKGDIIAGLITFKGSFKASGARRLTLSFEAFPGVTSPKSSCAHIAAVGTPVAKGQPHQFRIPAPPDGGNVSFAAEVKPYHGPGTYQRSSIVAVGASVIIGTSSYNLLARGATASVTFGADGSGELAFTHASAAARPRTLSGVIRWTCGG